MEQSRYPSSHELGLGCVNLGSLGSAGVSLAQHALDLGVSFFDTADAYGNGQSERTLGRALRKRRHEACIATKAGYLFRDRSVTTRFARGIASPFLQAANRRRSSTFQRTEGGPAYRNQDFSPSYLRGALERSLRRLGTDYVDLYQLHGPGAVDDDALAMMLEL